MQFIYAAPFILLSVVGFFACIVIPRLRQYRFQALVAPVAFGFCSIVAMVAIVVASDQLNLGLFTKPVSALSLLLIYVAPGLVGAWRATIIVTKVGHHRRV